jgi:hypothetical protein
MAGYVQIGVQLKSLTPDPNIAHRVRSPHYYDTDTIYFWTDTIVKMHRMWPLGKNY